MQTIRDLEPDIHIKLQELMMIERILFNTLTPETAKLSADVFTSALDKQLLLESVETLLTARQDYLIKNTSAMFKAVNALLKEFYRLAEEMVTDERYIKSTFINLTETIHLIESVNSRYSSSGIVWDWGSYHEIVSSIACLKVDKRLFDACLEAYAGPRLSTVSGKRIS